MLWSFYSLYLLKRRDFKLSICSFKIVLSFEMMLMVSIKLVSLATERCDSSSMDYSDSLFSYKLNLRSSFSRI